MSQVRLQQPGSPYSSSTQVVAAVVKADGIKGLWKGATPGVVRFAPGGGGAVMQPMVGGQVLLLDSNTDISLLI